MFPMYVIIYLKYKQTELGNHIQFVWHVERILTYSQWADYIFSFMYTHFATPAIISAKCAYATIDVIQIMKDHESCSQ
jgi:hypothetical protein